MTHVQYPAQDPTAPTAQRGLCVEVVRWPNAWPHTFGYHEFFHAFTTAAAMSHYVAVWFVVQ